MSLCCTRSPAIRLQLLLCGSEKSISVGVGVGVGRRRRRESIDSLRYIMSHRLKQSTTFPLPFPSSTSTCTDVAFSPRIQGFLRCRVMSAAFGTDANGKLSVEDGPSNLENREIMVQHLLLPEDKLDLLANLQYRIIKEGIDLSDLATEYSICPSKEAGGMLGWVRKGQLVPEFEESAFNAPLNKLVRCKTKHGWHLLQVLSEREGGILENIKPEDFGPKMEKDNFMQEVQLIDVREPEEVAIASLPGFKNYPLKQFGKWGPTITADLDPSKETYVLCHHGVRSLQVANWLQTKGFKRVYNISGGIHQYSLLVDSNVPTY